MILRKTRPDFTPTVKGGVVDLFCGIGGLSHGFVAEGFKVVAGIDVDSLCSHGYEANNNAKFVERDVCSLTGEMLNDLFPARGPRILVGCAPCQPFSTYAAKKGANNPRWKLLEEFSRLISESIPDVVSMENVPGLTRYQGGALFREFVDGLKELGYEVVWELVECSKLGVPQSRKRLVLLASRIGSIDLEKPRRKLRTVQDAIGHLEPVEEGKASENDSLHRAQGLSDLNLKRIRQSRPGGTWKDWDKRLVAKCHLKRSGENYGGVYGRMSWDEVAPTMTTQCFAYGSGRFGHPEQDRGLTLREASLLQTFPPYYEFCDPADGPGFQSMGRLIGNAVPVELGRCIARSIRSTIEQSQQKSSVRGR